MRKRLTLPIIWLLAFFPLFSQGQRQIPLSVPLKGDKKADMTAKQQPKQARATLAENFEGEFPPFGWAQIKAGGAWDKSDEVPDSTSQEGFFARFNVYDIQADEEASLVSPAVKPTDDNSLITFGLNYYLVSGDYGSAAKLYLDVSTDFGNSWSSISGNILDGLADKGWVSDTANLADYIGNPVQLRFRAVSDYGSYNIAIDEVYGPSIYTLDHDAGMTRVDKPADIVQAGTSQVKAYLKNYGKADLESVDIKTIMRDTVAQEHVQTINYSWSGNLPQKQEELVTTGDLNMPSSGFYTVKTRTENPNGATDSISTNNTASKRVVALAGGQVYEPFEGNGEVPAGWTADEAGWAPISGALALSGNQSFFIGQKNGDPAKKLITPKMDISGIDQLRFLLDGLYNLSDYGGTTVDILYATDKEGSWSTLTSLDMVDLGNEPQYMSIDISSIDAGSYYFALETTSDLEYPQNPSLTSYVFIDDFMGAINANASENDLAVKEVIYPSEFVYPGEQATIQMVVANVGIKPQSAATGTLQINGAQVGTANIPALEYYQRDTISFTWTPDESGLFSLNGSISADDNADNNTLESSGVVVEPGNLVEGFEFPDLIDTLDGWEFENGWYPTGDDGPNSPFAAYQGDSALICDGNGTGAYKDIKVITPKVAVDQSSRTVRFHAKFVNTNDTSQTTINLFYTSDPEEGDWIPVGEELVLSEQWERYDVTLKNVPEGNYHLAFSASSTYDSDDFSGYALLDHISGLSLPRPEVQYQLPFPEGAGVALDSLISMKFSEKVTALDFSGVQIHDEASQAVSGVAASLQDDQRTLDITHDPLTKYNHNYTVTVPGESVKNNRQTENNTISWQFTSIMKAPEASSLVPRASATGIALDADVSLQFNQQVNKADLSGVTIKGATQGEVSNVQASLSSDQLVITHDGFTQANESYTVSVPAGAVTNKDDVANNAISWSFATKASGQPAVSETYPAGNATGVDTAADTFYAVFDEAVTESDLSGITLKGENHGDVALASKNLKDDTLFIEHPGLIGLKELYTITVPQGAVTAGGTGNAAYSWSFRSQSAPPLVNQSFPANKQTGVANNAPIDVVFNEEIFESDFSLVELTGESSGQAEVSCKIIEGSTLRINYDKLDYGDHVKLTVPKGVVTNYDGTPNREISITYTTLYWDTYRQDFDGAGTLPEELKLYNGDNATPATAPASLADSAFVLREVDAMESAALLGTSAYDPAAAANDWVVLPGIRLNKFASLSWDAVSLDPDTILAEQYEVYLVKKQQDTTSRELLHRVEAETFTEAAGGEGASHHILNMFEYAEEEAFIAFRLNTPAPGADRLALDNISISRAHAVHFRITDGEQAVKNASLILRGEQVAVDTTGKAMVRLPEGEYAYSVNAPGYQPKEDTLIVKGVDKTQQVQLSETFYQVSFDVQHNGNAVEANVSIAGMQMQATDGNASLMLKSGSYPYQVHAEGYENASGTVTVDAAAVSKSVALSLKAYTVRMDVTAKGKPVENASVTIGEETYQTDLTGVVSTSLPNGAYAYTVNAPDLQDADGEFTVQDTALTVDVALTSTGLNNLREAGIHVYPNPAKGVFYVKHNKPLAMQLELRTFGGRLLQKHKIDSNMKRIELDGLASGIYLIKLIGDEEMHQGKLIIQR